MEATKTSVTEMDFTKEFTGTIFEYILGVGNSDIGLANKELSEINRIYSQENLIGKMNSLEIKVLALIIKAKTNLEIELCKGNGISNKEKGTSKKLVEKLSRDITILRALLTYLVKDRFCLPIDMNLNFKKDFQITARRVEHVFIGEIDE